MSLARLWSAKSNYAYDEELPLQFRYEMLLKDYQLLNIKIETNSIRHDKEIIIKDTEIIRKDQELFRLRNRLADANLEVLRLRGNLNMRGIIGMSWHIYFINSYSRSIVDLAVLIRHPVVAAYAEAKLVEPLFLERWVAAGSRYNVTRRQAWREILQARPDLLECFKQAGPSWQDAEAAADRCVQHVQHAWQEAHWYLPDCAHTLRAAVVCSLHKTHNCQS